MSSFVIVCLDSDPGSWIMGGGWNNDLWGGELPMASWIDEVTLMNPVSDNPLLLNFSIILQNLMCLHLLSLCVGVDVTDGWTHGIGELSGIESS